MTSKLPVKKTVELFYDVTSPYSWIAFEVLCRYRTKWNIDLKFKPFFFGGVMKGSGNPPPISVASKAVYMMQDLLRLKQFYQIPFNQPKDVFEVLAKKGSLPAQRLLTAVQSKQPELLEKMSRELWMRVWSRDEDIATPEGLSEALRSVGLNESQAADLLKGLTDKNIANKLKEVTQEALDLGAFGSPVIIVHDEKSQKHLLWGSDRTEILAMLLGEKYEGPLTELAAAKL